MLGKFFGLGVGPGDPKLLTLKAVEVLNSVQVVAVPKSRADRDSVALDIAHSHLGAGIEILELNMPMTSDPVVLEMAWQAGAEKIVDKLQAGSHVAFLTIGDPSLYSTYQYVKEKIKGIAPEVVIETIPGITSFAACAALVNQPLASGDEPLVILPVVDEKLGEYLDEFPNLVLMKVSRDYDNIVSKLAAHNKKGVFVSRCGTQHQTVIDDLNSLVGQEIDYLSLILVKDADRNIEIISDSAKDCSTDGCKPKGENN